VTRRRRAGVAVAVSLAVAISAMGPAAAWAQNPASVVLDCSSLQWAPRPNDWFEITGDFAAQSGATDVSVQVAEAAVSPGTEVAPHTAPQAFFADFATYPGTPQLTVSAVYTADGARHQSNACVISGVIGLADLEPDFISGPDRYATAVAVARKAYPEHALSVVIASGENYPDALSAGPAAARLGAPMLLVGRDSIPPEVRAEILSLAPHTIYVVGGPMSVSDGVLTDLSSLSAEIYRVSGEDRFSTSRAVASELVGGASSSMVASGSTFADAVSAAAPAAAVGAAILLVPSGSTAEDAATVDEIRMLRSQTATVVGGPAAVGAATQEDLATLVATTRIGGSDRYQTSEEVSNAYFGPSVAHAYLTIGTNFPDALSGASIAAEVKAPLLTTPQNCIPTDDLKLLARWGTSAVSIIGGTSTTRPELAEMRSCLDVDFFASHSW
jgi:putative cell wall-binding protein